jgi:stage III sporulation protein AE
LCGVLQRLQSATGEEGAAAMGKFIVFALAGIMLFGIFKSAVSDTITALDRMTDFLGIIVPILMVFMMSTGAVASAGLMQPVAAIFFGVIGSAVKGLVIPLAISGAAVSMVNNLSANIKLDKLGVFLKNLAKWILGAVFTVFVGVTTVKGLSAASFDGIVLRTAKYTVSGTVPVIGGMLGDSADLVVGCGLMIKNAIGTAGLGIIALTVLAPCIRLLVLTLALKGCAAVIQPVAGNGFVEITNELGDAVMVLFVSVGGCGLMVFLTVGIIAAMGNIAVMLR